MINKFPKVARITPKSSKLAPNDHLELPTFEQRHRTLFPSRKPLRKWEGGSRPSDLRIGRSKSPLRHKVELHLPSCPLAFIIRRLVAFEEGGENSSIATVASEIRRPIAGRERRAMLNLSREMGRSDGNGGTWHVEVKSSHHRRGHTPGVGFWGLKPCRGVLFLFELYLGHSGGPRWVVSFMDEVAGFCLHFSGLFPSSYCCFLFLSSDMASDW